MKTNQEIVSNAKRRLRIPNAGEVRENITLPTVLEGAQIIWASNQERVVSTKARQNENYDLMPGGIVTRQLEDTEVILTATIVSGEVVDQKKFSVCVKAKKQEINNLSYEGYLFVYFTGESEQGEQIYFALSKDGLHWEDINNGKPVLYSHIGEKGVRDPFLIRSPEGDKFYLIATDLRISNQKGWDSAQYEGSRALIIWESVDLVNWSDARRVEVGIFEAGCVWAPEAVYDYKTGEYMVFWASMVKEKGDMEPKQRIYEAKTRDFITFTKPQKYIERKNHVIDTTITEWDGRYYRYSKDETSKKIRIDTSKQLLHSKFETISSECLDHLIGVEGPLIFKFNEENKWCLMVDQYSTKEGYAPMVTDDLSSGIFRKLSNKEYSLGKNLKRHGTVLRITKKEYDTIKEKDY